MEVLVIASLLLNIVVLVPLPLTGIATLQTNSQSAESATTKTQIYFPESALEGLHQFISAYLDHFSEPSLFTATSDPNFTSYRFEFMSAQTGRVNTIRLSFNPDGTGTVTAVEESGTPPALHRTQTTVSPTIINRFMQRLEKSKFWSMPSTEPVCPDSGRKVIKLDASTWIFEGVHNGHYHVVLRRAPESSPFTEMVLFLVRDVANLSEPNVPRVSAPKSEKLGDRRNFPPSADSNSFSPPFELPKLLLDIDLLPFLR